MNEPKTIISNQIRPAINKTLIPIPTPSLNPKDPLNWPPSKKRLYLLTLSLTAFAAATAPACHQTAYPLIALTYKTTPVRLSYSIPAAVAGLLSGPFFLIPLAKITGRTALIFWTLVATAACQIWSACVTGEDQYVNFVVSRFVCGFFAGVGTMIGAGGILEVFFVHERGWAFVSYELSLLLGVAASPTIGGFVVEIHPWPVVFWWTLVPLGIAILLAGTLLEDTEYAPGRSAVYTVDMPASYLARRIRLLLGRKVTPRASAGDIWEAFVSPFAIACSPLTVMVGFYTFVNFGWVILVSTELAIFTQLPIRAGGYGFSPSQTAAFTFTAWVAILAAHLFGSYYNDRVPLWMAARRKGNERGRWRPEDRLWSLLIGPAIVGPIGLALVGVTLRFHLHYMVLALGYFFIAFSALLCVPVCINYVVENHTGKPVEVGVAMNAWRLAFGLALGFFFKEWQQAVGVGWLFGMAAIFNLFAMLVLASVAWNGATLRHAALKQDLVGTEAGEQIIR